MYHSQFLLFLFISQNNASNISLCKSISLRLLEQTLRRFSLAAIITISSLLKESSDGFDFISRTVQMIRRSQTSTKYVTYYVIRSRRLLLTLGMLRNNGQSSSHYRDFILAKGLIRWLRRQNSPTHLIVTRDRISDRLKYCTQNSWEQNQRCETFSNIYV